MKNYHATPEGKIPFTEAEDSAHAAEQVAWLSGARDRKAAEVRAERDTKIAACDWRIMKALESNQLQNFAWAAYRQALRDIPQQPGFPYNVTWPVEP